MKIVAKCPASLSPAYQVHVKVCNPIPLKNSEHSTQEKGLYSLRMSKFLFSNDWKLQYSRQI